MTWRFIRARARCSAARRTTLAAVMLGDTPPLLATTAPSTADSMLALVWMEGEQGRADETN